MNCISTHWIFVVWSVVVVCASCATYTDPDPLNTKTCNLDRTPVNCPDLDLSGLNFAGTDLQDANLSNTRLIGANFAGVNASLADFSNSDLTSANVARSRLIGANLAGADLTGVDLSRSNLTNADLTGAILVETDLTGTILDGVTLTGAVWSRTLCPNGTNSQDHADPNNSNDTGTCAGQYVGTIQTCELRPGTDCEGADLAGFDLRYVNLTNADLDGADLTAADLSGANLTGASAQLAIFTNTIWSNTTCPDGTNSNDHGNTCGGHLDPKLQSVCNDTRAPSCCLPGPEAVCCGDKNLEDQDLRYANLEGSTLTRLNARKADFTRANLKGADFEEAQLTQATFDNADFTDANLLKAKCFLASFRNTIWSNTICPDGTNSDNNGNTCGGHLQATGLSMTTSPPPPEDFCAPRDGTVTVPEPDAGRDEECYTKPEAQCQSTNNVGRDMRFANLQGASLNNAALSNAELHYTNLQNVDFTNTFMPGVNLTGANLNGSKLTGASDLNGILWSNTTCPDGTNSDSNGDTCGGHLDPEQNLPCSPEPAAVCVDLRGDQAGTHFNGANLTHANLTAANFERSSMRSALLSHATLEDTNFDQTDLSNARFNSASGDNASFEAATLHGADFTKFKSENASFARLQANAFQPDESPNQTTTDLNFTRATLIQSLWVATRVRGMRAPGADFTNAIFQGTHFSGDDCESGDENCLACDLISARFEDIRTETWVLEECNLTSSVINGNIAGFSATRSDLDSTNFAFSIFTTAGRGQENQPPLTIRNSTARFASFLRTQILAQEDTPARFERVLANSANFDGAQLRYVQSTCVDFHESLFEESSIQQSSFIANELTDASFYEANIVETNFEQTNLERANFEEAQLTEVSFARRTQETIPSGDDETDFCQRSTNANNVNMREANFEEASLEDVTFKALDMNHCNFEGADLINVVFDNVDLRGCYFGELEDPNAEFRGSNGTCPDGTPFDQPNAYDLTHCACPDGGIISADVGCDYEDE